MNDLIKIEYKNDNPTVLARDLHEKLEVETPYHIWFPRMCEYGFSVGKDYVEVLNKNVQNPQGGRPRTDHQITLSMAKELCMLQRSPQGKQFRQYFISIEEAWNKPEAVMARALQMANRKLDQLMQVNVELTDTVAVQSQQIAELQPKASYYDVVLNCKDLISTSVIAKDYGKSAIWLNQYLHNRGVQYKQGDIWLLYQKHAQKGLTNTKTQSYLGSDGKTHTKVHTYWTQKGRLFIYDLLKADGTVPLIEREGETA